MVGRRQRRLVTESSQNFPGQEATDCRCHRVLLSRTTKSQQGTRLREGSPACTPHDNSTETRQRKSDIGDIMDALELYLYAIHVDRDTATAIGLKILDGE